MVPTRIHQQLKANLEYKMLFADLAYKHMYHDGILSPTNAAAHYRYKASIIERAVIPESARWETTNGRNHTRRLTGSLSVTTF